MEITDLVAINLLQEHQIEPSDDPRPLSEIVQDPKLGILSETVSIVPVPEQI